MTATCICKYDKLLIVETEIFTHCTPVLARLFGIGEFAPPHTDEEGRLTFLKTFDIERRQFVPVISFLRSGFIDDIDYLMHTMNIFGGCTALDVIQLKRAKKEKQDETMKRMNPLKPIQNDLGVFTFEPHMRGWQHDGSWNCTAQIQGTVNFWWRKRNGVQNEIQNETEDT